MSNNGANLHKFNDSAFAIIGDDGSALLIDADIRRDG